MKNEGIASLFRVPLMLAMLIVALGTGQALADGTETLGTPSISIASGSGILAGGKPPRPSPAKPEVETCLYPNLRQST